MSTPLQPISGNATFGKPFGPITGKKRSHEQLAPIDLTLLDDLDDDEIEYDMSCDVIRRKIQNLIDSGEMKVTHFQRDLGINSNSYGRFMRLKGTWSGIDNQTFHAAYKFFKIREMMRMKEPNKNSKKRKSNDGTATSSSKNTVPDVSDITLPGEAYDKVEVYDSCDEIRRKIAAHIRKDGVTQAGFLRALAAQYHMEDRKIQSTQLNTFRKHHGPDAGNTSCVFYAAYVYFEKLRIKEGKDKSKHRLDMEAAWRSEGGFNVDRPGISRRGLWCGPGESFTLDSLGQFHIRGHGRY